MKQDTKQIILKKAVHTFAQNGYEGFSIRILAEQIPIAPSVVYHHFKDKDALLKEMFDQLNKNLGSKRSKLPNVTTASAMIRTRCPG